MTDIAVPYQTIDNFVIDNTVNKVPAKVKSIVKEQKNKVSSWYHKRVLPIFLSLAMLFSPMLAYADGGLSNLKNKIVFTRGNDIYAMDPDGTDQERIYGRDGWKSFAPSVSPDGRYIAFNSEREGDKNSRDIYVLDLETYELVNLTGSWNPDGRDTYPDFSPDGREIAFAGEKDGNNDIYVISANGGTPRRLTTDSGLDMTPSYSPDGERIAYANGSFNSLNLMIMDADGRNRRQITNTNSRDWIPEFSPDNEFIVFERDDLTNEYGNVFEYSLNNERFLQITNNRSGSRRFSEAPSYSPNGDKIVLIAGRGTDDRDANEVYIYDSNSKELIRITRNNIIESYPTWN